MGRDVEILSQGSILGVDILMIFVSLGTQDKPFYRILEKLENSRVNEEIIVQAGFTKFESKRMKIYEYVGPEWWSRHDNEGFRLE